MRDNVSLGIDFEEWGEIKVKIDEIIENIKSSKEYKDFLELKKKMLERGYQLDKKFAIFKDGKGDINIVEIYINLGECFMLEARNEQGESVGYMNIYFNPNKTFYLDVIYCYDAFRGRKIATNLSEIADYILQKYQGYVIRGSYEPQQLSTDRINEISRDNQELEQRADTFYFGAGYQKVSHKDFKAHPERFPNIKESDFEFGEGLAETIIIKTIRQKQKYPFQIRNGVLISENVLENQIEKE